MWSIVLSTGLVILLTYFLKSKYFSAPSPQNVPFVAASLPGIGHALPFSRSNALHFVHQCYLRYGRIFRIKIFRFTLTVLCDDNLVQEFFKSSEKELSSFEILRKLFFAEIFFPTSSHFARYVQLATKLMSRPQLEGYIPEIETEAEKFVDVLRQKVVDGESINILEESSRFVTASSAKCLTSRELSKPGLEALLQLSQLLNKAVLLAYLLPISVLRLCFKSRLSQLMERIGAEISPEVEAHMVNRDLKRSLFLREAVDLRDDRTGAYISVKEVKVLYVHLLYASTINTALLLSNALLELALEPGLTNEIYAEVTSGAALLSTSSLLHASVMKVARLNTQILSIGRAPGSKKFIGPYYVGDSDIVAVCGGLFQTHSEVGKDWFTDPETFNPRRFLENESQNRLSGVLAWGRGRHSCPGKMFALAQIKIGLAYFIRNLEIGANNPEETERRANHHLVLSIVEKLLDVDISLREGKV